VQFYTKCAVLVLFCAVLTANLSGGANSGPPGFLAELWGGEWEKWEEKKKKREKRGRRQRGGQGERRKTKEGREEFCAVVIFP